MTFIQRFGDALNLNVHFHMLALDGVYAEDKEGRVGFQRVPPPSDAEVARVAERVYRRVGRLLEGRGLQSQAERDEFDELQNSQPLLAELYGASISGRVASGPRAGRPTAKVGDAVELEDMAVPSIPRCATVAGFSVHANVAVPGQDRMRLERLCRYAGRPPVATERLSRLPGGRLLYRLKRRWRDGTTHLVFDSLELLEKLAALVPPPRFHLVRYHGVLAPSAAWRTLVIPESESAEASTRVNCPAGKPLLRDDGATRGWKGGCRPRNYSWAELMRRLFSVDVLRCARCGGRMRILAAIDSPEAIAKILDCLGLPSRPPPLARPVRLGDLHFA